MRNTDKNIALIEDHHEALGIWRKKGFRNLTLVHIDAHIDFGFQPAKPIPQAINEARSLKELKRDLEYTFLFKRFRKDLSIQTNIGNYIYPAMREGIIKDFYWVIPGGAKEFRESRKQLRALIRKLAKQDLYPTNSTNAMNTIKTSLMGRRFVITTLDYLPVFGNKVLLDVDTDFLVADSLKNANATSMIGKRKIWIQPEEFVKILREKIKNPEFITIAYSVNGGFTPMKYKHLGDEIACYLAPQRFTRRFKQKLKAGEYFNLFSSTGKNEYYKKAVRLNPTYGKPDNNYGPLYLSLGKFSKAEREFRRIADADPKNPYPSVGMGEISLQKKGFPEAKRRFSYALRRRNNLPEALFGLAQAEFRLKNFKKAKNLFHHYQVLKPMQPLSRYFLGCIYEGERNFEKAVACYQDTMRLGLIDIDVISRLLKTSFHIKAKDDVIRYALRKYRELKSEFKRIQRMNIKKKRKFKGLGRIEKKIAVLEKSINNNYSERKEA